MYVYKSKKFESSTFIEALLLLHKVILFKIIGKTKKKKSGPTLLVDMSSVTRHILVNLCNGCVDFKFNYMIAYMQKAILNGKQLLSVSL